MDVSFLSIRGTSCVIEEGVEYTNFTWMSTLDPNYKLSRTINKVKFKLDPSFIYDKRIEILSTFPYVIPDIKLMYQWHVSSITLCHFVDGQKLDRTNSLKKIFTSSNGNLIELLLFKLGEI